MNPKLAAKANRQLQDPLVVMTGHLPKWLPELMHSLSFVFPFETRLMYFCVWALDRDRAMQRLMDLNAFDGSNAVGGGGGGAGGSEAGGGGGSGGGSGGGAGSGAGGSHGTGLDRLRPRLDKRKKTINRQLDLFKQADALVSEFASDGGAPPAFALAPARYQPQQLHLRAFGITLAPAPSTSQYHSSSSSSSKPPLLEIQYENEVGTGLGPTLEFYALVSLEMQKCSHEMWRGDKIKIENRLGVDTIAAAGSKHELFYYAPTGLFPAPISLYIKGTNYLIQLIYLIMFI